MVSPVLKRVARNAAAAALSTGTSLAWKRLSWPARAAWLGGSLALATYKRLSGWVLLFAVPTGAGGAAQGGQAGSRVTAPLSCRPAAQHQAQAGRRRRREAAAPHSRRAGRRARARHARIYGLIACKWASGGPPACGAVLLLLHALAWKRATVYKSGVRRSSRAAESSGQGAESACNRLTGAGVALPGAGRGRLTRWWWSCR